jgi:hypothetical protein
VLVDAELVDGRNIDAVEPVGEVAKLKRAAIPEFVTASVSFQINSTPTAAF